MSGENLQLTQEDVQRLLHDPSVDVRADLVRKTSFHLDSGGFNAKEAQLAIEIFRLLARDAELRVRQALAENLKASSMLPHDIALQLAKDVDEVSLPVIEYSYVLTEEDLVDLVESTTNAMQHIAIARRENVSSKLSDALVETQNPDVIKTLVANQGAVISEQGLNTILAGFGSDRSIQETLIQRGGMPLAMAEKMISMVSEDLQQRLIYKYHLPKTIAMDAAEQVRESALINMLTPDHGEMNIEELVEKLHKDGRLSSSLIVRSLCSGDLRFFESALAKLAGIPVHNARKLIMDPGPLGFRALYESAQMPEGFFQAVKTFLRIALEETEGGKLYHEDYQKRMLRRIQGEGHDKHIENMPYLISIIGNYADCTAA